MQVWVVLIFYFSLMLSFPIHTYVRVPYFEFILKSEKDITDWAIFQNLVGTHTSFDAINTVHYHTLYKQILNSEHH